MSVFAGIVAGRIAANDRGNQDRICLFVLHRLDILFIEVVLERTTAGNRTGRVGVAPLFGTFVVMAKTDQHIVAGLHTLQQSLILVRVRVGLGAGAGDGKIADIDTLQIQAELGAPAVTRGVVGGVAECGCGGVAYDPDGGGCGWLVNGSAAGLLFGIGSRCCGEGRIVCGCGTACDNGGSRGRNGRQGCRHRADAPEKQSFHACFLHESDIS